MREDRMERFARQFYLFFTGCLVGWIYEVTLGFIYGYGFVNRGFLFGPYLPVYGFGLLLLNLLLHRLMEKPIRVGKVKLNFIFVFFGIVVITTILEYIVGWSMLQIFHRRWWDYTSYWMNYQGIISFKTSLRFGIGGLFLLYALVPLAEKIRKSMSEKVRRNVMAVILAVMLLDLVVTLLHG